MKTCFHCQFPCKRSLDELSRVFRFRKDKTSLSLFVVTIGTCLYFLRDFDLTIWILILSGRLPEVWGKDADQWNPERFMGPKDKQVSLGVYADLYVILPCFIVRGLICKLFQVVLLWVEHPSIFFCEEEPISFFIRSGRHQGMHWVSVLPLLGLVMTINWRIFYSW